jgi:hypothetical protein
MEVKICEVTCFFLNLGFGFHKEHKSVFIKIMFEATGKEILLNHFLNTDRLPCYYGGLQI